MELIKLVCPHCGAIIEEEIEGNEEIKCTYCGGKIYIDDDVYRVEIKENRHDTKNININSKTEHRYVDEGRIAETKTNRIFIFVYLFVIIFMLVGSFIFGYKYSETKHIVIPQNDIEISFKDVVLGTAREESELIVYEQDLSVESEITKDGWFEWAVFKKNKKVTYAGTAHYTVNLGLIKDNDIVVNQDKKTITIFVPKVALNMVHLNPDKIQFEATKKGLLSPGELKFTLEEAFYIESQALELLKEKANQDECLKKADKAAVKVVSQIFTKAIYNIDSNYNVDIKFY